MSMSAAINNALLGLARNTHATNVVASNISHASEPGYARREIVGDQIQRNVDPVLLSDRRLSDAETAFAQTTESYAQGLSALSGAADEAGSLQNLMSVFDTALLSAAADPASEQRLNSVAAAGMDLAIGMRSASASVQSARSDADSSIATQVERLNALLQETSALNNAIAKVKHGGIESASLLDQRQSVVDEIATIVPVHTARRDRNGIALYTTNGAVLVDDSPANIGFTPTPVIASHMTGANGLLGGLSINGRPVSSSQTGPLAGGSLSAEFQARDDTLPSAQASLDAIAYDLIERFGAGGPDSTLNPGDIGLFSELGTVPGAPPVSGLSERITWNPAVASGSSDVWRLRDGLGAAMPGEVGDGTLLNGLSSQLTALLVPSDPTLDGNARSAMGQISSFASTLDANRIRSEDSLSRVTSRNTALKEIEFTRGVDTDVELQRLLKIEQSYAANAQILRSVDEMMNQLLSI
ncbi:FlgK family flagellar hook-associated protein [Roseivivax sp. CAU 1753]